MKVLLTGAFGNVGKSTLEALLSSGHQVRLLERNTPKNKKLARQYGKKAEIQWGDIRNIADVGEAVKGCEGIIHTAAIIPPLADEKPVFAHYINVGGTENLIKAAAKENPGMRFLFTSSISIYGDRLQNPLIKTGDRPNPNDDDQYAKQKLLCEELLRTSGLNWTIFRLTYIVSTGKLNMDPLMFSMPLATSIEICDTRDTGTALANALTAKELTGKTLPIAGGEKCRITYKKYLDRMLEIFGLGRDWLPAEAFSKEKFHCGFMETGETESYLHFQKSSLEDYFEAVRKKSALKRFFLTLIRPLARSFILKRSPYLQTKN